MENIYKYVMVLTSGIFHFPYRGVDVGRHSHSKTTEYKSAGSPLPPFKCNVLRESLSAESQNLRGWIG
jgi:hypothetical protein